MFPRSIPTGHSQLALVTVCLWVGTTACARTPADPTKLARDSRANQHSEIALSGPNAHELTVSAAASTKELVEELARQFAERTGTRVRVNVGPSGGLANQILAGAPADLFLSANAQWADKVGEDGLATASTPLLTNRLVLVVPRGNPSGVRQPQDLVSARVARVALAGEQVPAGMYADQVLTRLGLLERLVHERRIARGQDVRSALSYVERGEVDAGIVYATDVRTASNVEIAYEFDASLHDEIVYVLVLLKHGGSQASAVEFYDFLRSPDAEPTYGRYGFVRLIGKAPRDEGRAQQ